MDASHMGMIQQYSNAGSASGSSSSSGSRPIPTRSQTNPPVPDFEFSLPNVRPGLAKIGRRISEMSDNFLYETDVIANDGPGGLSRSASRKGVPRIQEERHVPFMGDEPVFCPFCEKPLPPGLLSQHTHLEPPPMPRKALAVPASASMSKTTSAPEGSKGLLSALPVVTPPIAPAKPEPRTTSEELATPVKAGDMADHAASKVSVSDDDLRRWAKIAGVELDLPVDATIAQKEPESTAPAKPFPKLAPPPEDEARSTSTSRNSGRFGFFGGKSGKDEDDEEEESDDDQGGASGYSRLDAPASPEREEKPLELLDFKERKVTETVQAKEPEPVAPVEPVSASEEEVRAVLKEVLAKVNEMAKSHTSVLHSHSTLLTTLKIARSNLAMAEANAEMLEEQLKRYDTPTKPPRPSHINIGPPGSMGPPPPRPAAPTRTTTTPAPLAQIQPGGSSSSTPAVRHSTESTRPHSIQIPNSANPRTPVSASSESSKGMFGGFWNRNKDKVEGFMNSLPDLTPTAERNSFDFAKSPNSPPSAMTQGPSVLPDGYRATSLNRSKTVHGRVGESDTMQRSSSFTNVRDNVLKQPAVVPRQPMDPYTLELTRLRAAQATSQTKIESMSKELADLKKGKVEMEAELENLSQALFEEANKMVADERKKCAELEESLKEVKDEREALRETIKVLGGQVEDRASNSSVGDPDEQEQGDKVAELPGFQPRDLDKHYEALRKSIHHVSDNQYDDEEPIEALARTTSASVAGTSPSASYASSLPRRHSLPDIASPEVPAAPALHDPWADSGSVRSSSISQDDTSPTGSRSDLASSLGDSDAGQRIRRGRKESSASRKFNVQGQDRLDEQDEYDGQLQADIELESPVRDKVAL